MGCSTSKKQVAYTTNKPSVPDESDPIIVLERFEERMKDIKGITNADIRYFGGKNSEICSFESAVGLSYDKIAPNETISNRLLQGYFNRYNHAVVFQHDGLGGYYIYHRKRTNLLAVEKRHLIRDINSGYGFVDEENSDMCADTPIIYIIQLRILLGVDWMKSY